MTTGQDIVDFAKKFLGTPYAWGGNSLTKGVDCSGLVQQVFKNFGIGVSRTTYTQIGEGTRVSMKGLRPGDLVFFEFDGGKDGPDHVGIYAGGGKMVHAPRPGKSVEVVDITKGYYADTFVSGRRIDGVRVPGGSEADFDYSAPKLTEEELAANYGWAIGFLNSVPELKKKFDKAVDDGWTKEKFQAELRDTKWWKETSETRRQAQVMKKTDPATWKASMTATKLMLRQIAAQVGAAIPESRLDRIAKDVLELGLEEDGIRNVLGQYVTFTREGTLKGEAGMHEFKIRQYAADQGVELSDDAVKNQAQLIVRKLATQQDFESQIQEQAISALPGYAEQIKGGMTVKQIASPYMQMMAQELELPHASIKLNDPIIKNALNAVDQDGKPTGMSVTNFETFLRNDPRWKRTKNAQDQMFATGKAVLQDMGILGG